MPMSDSPPNKAEKPDSQDSASPLPDVNEQLSAKQAAASTRVAHSMRQLRDRVEESKEELLRLRATNSALAQRVRELESTPLAGPTDLVLSFDQDPKEMRATVDGFIEAIDKYLANDSS